MKKTIYKSDGSQEEIEGSPEEIAAYELEISKRSGESVGQPVQEDRGPGRRVLTDEYVRALERIAGALERMPNTRFIPYYEPPAIRWPWESWQPTIICETPKITWSDSVAGCSTETITYAPGISQPSFTMTRIDAPEEIS